MSLAGLPEDLARTIRQTRPRQVVEKERAKNAPVKLHGAAADAHGKVQVRIFTCELFLRAIRAAAKVLDASGRDLQRIHSVVCAKDGFRQALDSGDPPAARSGIAALEALRSLGESMCGFSAVLAGGETLDGLEKLRGEIAPECAPELEKVAAAVRAEKTCETALELSREQKAKMEKEVASHMQDGTWSGWLMGSKSAAPDKQQATQLQHAAVQDLASRVDSVAAAVSVRERCLVEFGVLLQKIDGCCVEQLQELSGRCVGALAPALEQLEAASKRLASGTTGDVGSLPVRTPRSTAAGAQRSTYTPRNSSYTGPGAAYLAAEREIPITDLESFFIDMEPQVRDSDESVRGQEGPPHTTLEACLAEGMDKAPATPRSHRGSPRSHRGSPRSHRGSDAGGGAADDDAASDGEGATQMMVVFGKEVERLGFEVVWEPPRPSVLKLIPDGAAQRVGLMSGDVILEMNGKKTYGKSRSDLMPLLKDRPLNLLLRRDAVGGVTTPRATTPRGRP